MTKPWKTKEWKEKREKLIEGKVCEWCGSKKSLSLHHKTQYPSYEMHYQLVSHLLLEQLVKDGVYKTENKDACPYCNRFSLDIRSTILPKYRCFKCKKTFEYPIQLPTKTISKEDYARFHQTYANQIKEIVDRERQAEYENYIALDDIMILCKRCHKAIGQGKVLCQTCKKSYHNPNFKQCWNCFSQTEKGKLVSKKHELLEFVHPWCGKVFKIEVEDWEFEASPQMCCIEHCEDNEPNSCAIASKKWNDIEADGE